MNEFIHTIKIGNSNKSLSLELYENKFSLVSTWETRDGAVKPNWCFRQDRVDGENVPGKAIPLKLYLGDKAEAVSMLMQLLSALGHPATGKPANDDSEIPF